MGTNAAQNALVVARGARGDFRPLRTSLEEFDPRMRERIKLVLGRGASMMEAYAKSTARWTDRTGFARSSLHAHVTEDSLNVLGITLAHGAPYGIWLEVRRDFHGRYAIIMLTVETVGPQIMAMMGRVLLG